MDEKTLVKLGATVLRELIDVLEKELIGEPEKEKKKDGKRRRQNQKRMPGNITDNTGSS